MRILTRLGFLIAFRLIQSGTVSAQNGAMASVAANRPALIPKPRQLKWDSGSRVVCEFLASLIGKV